MKRTDYLAFTFMFLLSVVCYSTAAIGLGFKGETGFAAWWGVLALISFIFMISAYVSYKQSCPQVFVGSIFVDEPESPTINGTWDGTWDSND